LGEAELHSLADGVGGRNLKGDFDKEGSGCFLIVVVVWVPLH
jgi:hypothetical protein